MEAFLLTKTMSSKENLKSQPGSEKEKNRATFEKEKPARLSSGDAS